MDQDRNPDAQKVSKLGQQRELKSTGRINIRLGISIQYSTKREPCIAKQLIRAWNALARRLRLPRIE
jgi:hypothetical protein